MDGSAPGGDARADAVAQAVRAAAFAVAELDPLRAPRIAHWVGSAASAAHEALDDVDRDLRSARQAAVEFQHAARAAVGDG